MLETMAFAAPALLVLLALDALRHPRDATTGARREVRLLLAARIFSVFLFAGNLARGCRVPDHAGDTVLFMIVFGLTGLAAIELAPRLAGAALRGFRKAADQGNHAAATTLAAHSAAVGIQVANLFAGTSWLDLGVAVAAFAVAQASLLLLVWAFRALTSYDDHAQILAGNLAAALSHGGLTIAMALLVAHASDGEFDSAWSSLRDYGIALAEGLLVYPLRQFVVQCLLLRERPTLLGGGLDRAIGEQRDVGAGALEAATYIAAVLFVRSLV